MGCAAKNPEESDIRGATTASVSPVCDVTAAVDEPRAYRIQPGDQLDVSFYLSPELHQNLTVRPDGDISIPIAGNVHAQGLTPGQLESSLDHLYALVGRPILVGEFHPGQDEYQRARPGPRDQTVAVAVFRPARLHTAA